MKRSLCLLVGLCMLVCAGCGYEVEPPMVEHMQETAAAAATNAPVAAPAAEKVAFSRGVWEENAYVSDYASLWMTLPEGWAYADALELEEMTERDADGEIITLTDLYAQRAKTGESVIVFYENLSGEGAAMSAQEYADIVAQALSEEGDIPYNVLGTEIRTLCGEEYICLRGEVEGYDMQQYYFIRRIEGRMLVIITTVKDEALLTDLFR